MRVLEFSVMGQHFNSRPHGGRLHVRNEQT